MALTSEYVEMKYGLLDQRFFLLDSLFSKNILLSVNYNESLIDSLTVISC